VAPEAAFFNRTLQEVPGMNARAHIIRHYPVWLALLTPLAVAAVMLPLRSHVPNTSLALAMVVVVALVVLPGHRLAALIAGLSAGVWFDFFFTRPYESFSIQRSADVQTTVLLALVGVVIGEIAARRRQARGDMTTARGEVLSLYVIAEMLASGSKAEQVVTLVGEQLRELLFLVDCRFESDGQERNGPVLDRSGELLYGRLEWDLDREGFPNRDVVLAVEAGRSRFGSYILRGPALGVPISQDRRLAAVALSDLAGAALSQESSGPDPDRYWTPSRN
jgi:hypothetical protein